MGEQGGDVGGWVPPRRPSRDPGDPGDAGAAGNSGTPGNSGHPGAARDPAHIPAQASPRIERPAPPPRPPAADPEPEYVDDDPAQRLLSMMGEARDVLARLRDREESEDDRIEIIGVGSSKDGHVSLVLDRTGNVESLALDRHARGLGSEVLATQILAAYAIARQDLGQQLQEQIRSGGMADPYEANEKLIEAQSNALKQSLGMIESLNSTMNRITRAAGTDD